MHIAQRKRWISGTGGKDKTTVLGMLERGGKLRTTVIENRKKQTLQPEIKAHVAAGWALYSDELLSYEGGWRAPTRTRSSTMPSSIVDGQVHTNGMENDWALLKRGINGSQPWRACQFMANIDNIRYDV